MSWVLSLARSGGTAGSQGGHEIRRHRVRGPFPMGACLLLAGTLALAGCGSSSSSTVAINERQPPPELEIEPQTGDGDGDTGSGDTPTTDDGGTTITQQQQPPQEPLEPEPEPEPQPVTQQPSNQPQPQNSGGTGGGTGGGGQGGGGGNLGSSRSPAGTSGGITRSGFDSIEAHSHIKDELFPKEFWELSTENSLKFSYKISDENDRINTDDHSGRIKVGIRGFLTEDTNTKVPDNYGWQGKRLTHGNTEAYIYTNKATGIEFKDKYNLNSNSELGDLKSYQTVGWQRIRLDETVTQSLNKDSQITYSVGGTTYNLFLNDVASQDTFKVLGSYDGVPGYFKCYPSAIQQCTIGIRNDRVINGNTVDDYEFGTYSTILYSGNRGYKGSGIEGNSPTWYFKPNNPNQVVPGSIEDYTRHYNYGWWLNKDNWSSFANYYPHGYNGQSYNNPVDPSGRTGTATYVGGAGGYYAFVHGEKGMLNGYPFDAREPGISGEFRAKARLEVNFTNNTMSGKIFNFTNPDGTPIRNNNDGVAVKDWTVELLNGSYTSNQVVEGNKAKWYDGEFLMEGGEDGKWEGEYYEDTSIFMGQFLASYGTIGKMIGSFGTNRQ